MKLLLRRDQRSSVLGKMIFVLEVRADLNDEERQAISKYKLGDSVLYEKNTMVDPGSGLLGLASRVAFKAMNMSVSVKDLTNGKKLECKDIVEMLAVEDQLKEAGKTFNAVLQAARRFGGEEVIDLAA
ncbi:MAG: hypothetical protein JO208_05505 [Alphaproteobacteria bacterium]|nr:hypothetical protein [Alphaproteobacteria bacterium]